jgi:hypothetical protein
VHARAARSGGRASRSHQLVDIFHRNPLSSVASLVETKFHTKTPTLTPKLIIFNEKNGSNE